MEHQRFVCTYEAYGARFAFELADEALRQQVARALPPGARRVVSSDPDLRYDLRRDGPRYRLARDDETLCAGASEDFLLRVLRADLDTRVARFARPWLFVHAGVVGCFGRALVIPGHSLSGKTTLVAALARAGAQYLSDEYAAFDEDGLVHPYPRPLSLRGPEPYPRIVSAAELGLETARSPLPVGLVLATRYVEGARWRPVELTAGEAALKVVENTVMARSRSKEMLKRLARAVTGAVALAGERGEAEEVAKDLLRRMTP